LLGTIREATSRSSFLFETAISLICQSDTSQLKRRFRITYDTDV
jgi:hypothetical protein